MDTTQTLSDVQREYGLRSCTYVNVSRVTVAYHCEQSDGEHTIAVTNGPNTIYLTGTTDDLAEFVLAVDDAADCFERPVSDVETGAV